MAASLLGSAISGDPLQVGLRLLLLPLGSNVVMRTVCFSVEIGLPVYSTFKAIESKDQNEQERWLVYWTVYGSFSLVEIFSDKILSWFPCYYYVKFAFLVWLQFPTGKGSRQLYRRSVRPFLLRHQAKLDQVVNFTSAEVARFLAVHNEEIQFLRAAFARIALSANQTMKDVSQPLPQGCPAIESGREQSEGSDAATDS